MRRILIFILSVLLLGILPLGCNSEEPAPISGGTTDQTNLNAPKEIESKEIVRFKTNFCLLGEWSEGREDRFYTFTVEQNKKGAKVATERETGVNAFASGGFMIQLQNIIDAYNLVENNGVYRVTAGLAPEYQECSFFAEYESGEKLTFTINNDPKAEWAKAIYLLFADLFHREGNDTLLPPQHKGDIKSFRFVMSDDGETVEITEAHVEEQKAIDGQTDLLAKYQYNLNGDYDETYIVIPDSYYETLSELINSSDLRAFDPDSILYGWGRTVSDEQDTAFSLQMELDYADGYSMQIETTERSDFELLRPLIEDLSNYFNILFQ